MFSDANIFNNGGEASIGQWDTSNVTYMRSMFEAAGASLTKTSVIGTPPQSVIHKTNPAKKAACRTCSKILLSLLLISAVGMRQKS